MNSCNFYAIQVKIQTDGGALYPPLIMKELPSEQAIKSLRKELLENDPEREPLYFPWTAQALKIDNCILRYFVCLVPAILLDILTLPVRYFYTYPAYIEGMKDQFPIIKYLKKEGISEDNLTGNRYSVRFYSAKDIRLDQMENNPRNWVSRDRFQYDLSSGSSKMDTCDIDVQINFDSKADLLDFLTIK